VFKRFGVPLCKTMSFTLFVLVMTTGCITIPSPKVFSEQKGSGTTQPPKNVLIVIDLSLEFDQLPSGVVFSKEDNAKKMYEPVAKKMVEEVKKTGAEASYVLHYTKASLDLSTEYSHVWLQRLDRLVKTSNNAGYYISSRIWRGSIAQRQAKTDSKLTLLYNVEYQADGPRCFTVQVIANKDDCQKEYITTVLGQWDKSGLKP
jgi:hypothetical protein